MDPQLKQGNTNELVYLLNNGVKIYIIYEQKNFMYNWIGGKNMVESINWKSKEVFNKKELSQIPCGRMKKVDNLKFVVMNNTGKVTSNGAKKCIFEELNDFLKQ